MNKIWKEELNILIRKSVSLWLSLLLALNFVIGAVSVSAADDPTHTPISSLNPAFSPTIGRTVSWDGTSALPVTITFNKAVQVNPDGLNRSLTLFKSDDSKIVSLPIGTGTLISGGKVASFSVPAAYLGYNQAYYITLDDGAFTSPSDPDTDPATIYGGVEKGAGWIFTTSAAPVSFSSLTPVNGATEVSVGTSLTLAFSRAVTAVSGKTITVSGAVGSPQNISVTSNAVTIGGTGTITITPAQLAYNTTYSVSVPAGAFQDGDGNPSPAVTNWSFTTASSTSGSLHITSLSPSNGSTTVSVTKSTLTATFSSAIKWSDSGSTSKSLGTATGVVLYKYVNSSPSTVAGTVAVSGSTLTVAPSEGLTEGTNYYVLISPTVIADASTGAYYSGLTSSGSWSFTTATADKTAPVLQSAQMYTNSIIRLQYDEMLNPINLTLSSFTVTVNGETRRLTNAYASGNSVYVSLEVGVAVGQVVRISYSAGATRIEDTSYNAALSFSSRDVTNGLDSAMPKPKDGYISGYSVVLNFENTLQDVSSYAYRQFTVKQDGVTTSVTSITQSGSTIILNLSRPAVTNAVVKVSYTPGAYPLQDFRGLDIAGFTDFFVRNFDDTRPPQFKGAQGSGSKVVLTYDEALDPANVPIKSQFSVLVNNSPVYVTGIDIVDNQVFLTLASSFTSTQNVTVSYVSGVGGLTDLNSNLAGFINLEPVQYGTAAQGIRSASVNGDTLKVQFNSVLMSSSPTLSASLFTVSVDSSSRGIQSASISSDTLTLTLSSPVTTGQTVTFSYLGSILSDSQGNKINTIDRAAVQNLTGGSSNGSGTSLPANLTLLSSSEFGQSGYLLDKSTATASSGYSRNGQTVNKYVVDASKLADAYTYIATNSSANSRVLLFDVPSTERAAYVGFPLKTLMDAFTRSSDAKVGVRFGDNLYVLPLSQIPFSTLGISMAADFNTVKVWIQLERLSTDNISVINGNLGVSTFPLMNPVDLFVSAATGSNADLSYLSVNGQLSIRTGGDTTTSNSAMYLYDRTTQKAIFLPTHLTSSGAYTAFTAEVNGGSALVGPRSGYASLTDTKNHWASSAITELVSKSIMDPASSGLFKPQQNITRAEFATYIAKGLGLQPDSASAARFTDVSQRSDVAGYIGAAVKAGIVAGVSDSSFKPGSYITREQMTLMMVRAMSAASQPLSQVSNSDSYLAKFKDSKQITSSSKAAVAQAVNGGIIQGTSAGTFNPKGTATRAEAAVMIKRVLDKLGFLQ